GTYSECCTMTTTFGVAGSMDSGVEVDGDLVGGGESLAGKDKTLVEFVLVQGVVAAHLHGAGGDLGAAGAAHATLAGEREIGANPLRGIEDGHVDRQRQGGLAAVEDHGDLGGRALGPGVLGALGR